jgi:inner membrane protein
MASVFSHAVATLGISACFYREQTPKRVWAVGALCAVIPDLDVIGFHFGVRYADFWGHRGFTHSLLFAAVLATASFFAVFSGASLSRISLWFYFFLCAASHGLLDAMTDGGLGVAFFSPFDNRRYFLPWRPIQVSPIGVTRFFTPRGLAVLQSELLYIWLPSALIIALIIVWRRQRPSDPERRRRTAR